MWDEAEYASLARAIAAGQGYSTNGSPEYSAHRCYR